MASLELTVTVRFGEWRQRPVASLKAGAALDLLILERRGRPGEFDQLRLAVCRCLIAAN